MPLLKKYILAHLKDLKKQKKFLDHQWDREKGHSLKVSEFNDPKIPEKSFFFFLVNTRQDMVFECEMVHMSPVS